MSQWGRATAKERESAPESIFCGPHRSFPVADQADVDNAVSSLGRAGGSTAPIKSCIIRRANANNWTLPKAWMGMSAGQAIAPFTLAEFASSDAIVTRRGKVFQDGAYPDKEFTATLEDLYAAVSTFAPVPNDLEHMPTILDGKLGQLKSVALADDGSLTGEVEIPRWLHETIGDAPIKTSLMWDRETMRIVGNALVIEPRVPDAALMSAYEAFSASHGTPPATVQETADPVGVLATIKALLFGQDPKTAATVPPVVTAPATAEEVTVADAVQFKDTEEYQAMQSQIAQLLEQDKQRAAREAARDAEVIRERAATWAEAEIASFRALPAERAALIAAYSDAATDDAATPRVVSFAAKDGTETTGNRVDALKARQAARAQHMLTVEQLRMTPEQLAEAGVVFAQRPAATDSQTMTKQRHDELVRLSGFSVLNND
jgi:hypothetical protein